MCTIHTVYFIHVHVHVNHREKALLRRRHVEQDSTLMMAPSVMPYLDKVLSTLKVHREAYYGGTFTENHAHKYLQVCRHTCT